MERSFSLLGLSRVFNVYFRALDKLFTLAFGPLLGGAVIAELRLRPSGTIDERLTKIEAAKQNLLESLDALDDLRA